jgi:hypothetical protein
MKIFLYGKLQEIPGTREECREESYRRYCEASELMTRKVIEVVYECDHLEEIVAEAQALGMEKITVEWDEEGNLIVC